MSHQIIKIFFYTVIITVAWSCAKKTGTDSKVSRTDYYPVRDFIINDYKANRANGGLKKKITINGAVSEETLSGPVKPSETEILEQLYINNPKYAGYYKGDTTYSLGGEIEKIIYKATHIEAAVKNIEINFVRGKVQRVYARSVNGSLVSAGRQELIYRPGKGYYLSSTQKVLSKDTLKLEVDAAFIPAN